jgi:hypothetical protein
MPRKIWSGPVLPPPKFPGVATKSCLLRKKQEARSKAGERRKEKGERRKVVRIYLIQNHFGLREQPRWWI